MTDRPTTREQILDASRRLFNEMGYAGTTVAAIAAEVGIAEGNLWYHFRTKLDLVRALEERVRQAERKLRAGSPGGTAADDYASTLLASMTNSWRYRFLMRDAALFGKDGLGVRRDPDMVAGVRGLERLLARMRDEGLFRRDPDLDLRELARSVWIVGRYWPDHLREIEGLQTMTRSDEERGFLQSLAVLRPSLNAEGRRQVHAAFAAALAERVIADAP